MFRDWARRRHHILWLARYRPAAEVGGHGHGTAVAIPLDMIERKENETQNQAEARVTRSLTGSKCGRVTAVRTLVGGKPVKLVSAYAPSKGVHRPAFFRNSLDPHLTKNTVLSIDANCVPDVVLDTQRPSAVGEYDNRGAGDLADVLRKHELSDVAREQLGSSKLFTAHHVNVHHQITRTRIDQLYAPNLDGMLWTHKTNHSLLPARTGLPDHVGLELNLELARGERGKDLARINPRVYEDPTTHSLLEECIDTHFFEMPPTDMCEAWTKCKAEIRTISLKRTGELRLQDTTQARVLKIKIKRAQSNIEDGSATPGTEASLAADKKALADLTTPERTLNQTLENMAYTRGQMHDVGSAAMFRRLHSRSSDQWVNAVMDAQWDDPSTPTNVKDAPVADASKIADAFVPYYESLYSKKTPDPEALRACLETLDDPQSPRVLPPTADACGADVATCEVEDHCGRLPAGKSPGPDRIPNDFYKAFKSKLAPILAKVFNQAHDKGSLPPDMTEGLVSVLYKKKDRKDPRNYRPITLLNGDYKILMRILTARMNAAVVQFVSAPQNGFVPNSFIVENILLLQMLQTYAEEEDIEALFIFLDFEKAFDRVSWDYLQDALRAIGFPDVTREPADGGEQSTSAHPFLRWVQLAYSHDHPPTRKMSINGYLSRAFAIASGVAQGCPLSPLLFLLATEALTRIILNDSRISGIKVGDLLHKISQFADDSTLIATPRDVPFFNEDLDIYCRATSMKENLSKREAQLLAKLARRRDLAPSGVVRDDKYPEAGESTRALGYPIGTFSTTAWFRAKYREAKTKAAAMNPYAHAGIVGRNMILQAKYLSYFRFWLFGLIMPKTVSAQIESDIKHLLWSSAPDLQGDEDGTSAAVAPQMTKKVSHLPIKKGGASLMHWGSHVRAFQLQWVLRYIDPRRAPWKSVLDYWIAGEYHIGRKILFVPHAKNAKSFASHLPAKLRYLRACFREFQKLPLKQDISRVTPHVAAEPLFNNARFRIPLSDTSAYQWKEHLETRIVSDLIDRDTDEPFTAEAWNGFFYQMAPDPSSKAVHSFADKRIDELPIIMRAVPNEIARAAGQLPSNPDYVAFVSKNNQYDIVTWAKCIKDKEGSVTAYAEVWLDASGIPHRTGRTVPPFLHHVVPAVTWIHPKEADAHEDDHGAPPSLAPASHAGVVRIQGTLEAAFPLNEGWTLEGSKHTSLTKIFNIHNMTQHLTELYIGDVKPNAEAAWNSRVQYQIPWPAVWKSLGTPLSDASEEKQWRKLLHRALFTRNRDSRAPSKRCRLGCNCDESMLHLAQCPCSRALWSTLLSALQALSDKVPDDMRSMQPAERAIIFGALRDRRLLTPLMRATYRHAWQALYRNLTLVDVRGIRFCLERVVLETLNALRDAALRLGKAHVIALCYWDGVDESTRPELQPITSPLIAIDAVSERPHVAVKLTDEFKRVLEIARANLAAAKENSGHA